MAVPMKFLKKKQKQKQKKKTTKKLNKKRFSLQNTIIICSISEDY